VVHFKGSYIRSAGTKSAAILDGTKLCRVEELRNVPVAVEIGRQASIASGR